MWQWLSRSEKVESGVDVLPVAQKQQNMGVTLHMYLPSTWFHAPKDLVVSRKNTFWSSYTPASWHQLLSRTLIKEKWLLQQVSWEPRIACAAHEIPMTYKPWMAALFIRCCALLSAINVCAIDMIENSCRCFLLFHTDCRSVITDRRREICMHRCDPDILCFPCCKAKNRVSCVLTLGCICTSCLLSVMECMLRRKESPGFIMFAGYS